jgi:hypothetical protein
VEEEAEDTPKKRERREKRERNSVNGVRGKEQGEVRCWKTGRETH